MSSHASSGLSSVKRHGSMSSSHHARGHHGDLSHHELSHTLPAHHHYDTEWEAKEELRLRELEEARARAAQMEKTMRWWSDCTANWREKWSKVRTERNKAREESRLLRTKLESTTKDLNNMKREKQDKDSELDILRKEVEQLRVLKSFNSNLPLGYCGAERDIPQKHSSECQVSMSELLGFTVKPVPSNATVSTDHAFAVDPTLLQTTPDKEFLDNLLRPKAEKNHVVQVAEKEEEANVEKDDDLLLEAVPSDDAETLCSTEDKTNKAESPSKLIDHLVTPDPDELEQRMSALQLRLDEATKMIQVEREAKSSLHKAVEKYEQELNDLKLKYDDLKQLKQVTLKELNQIKSVHQDEIETIRLDLEDEANSRSSMDRRLADLRSQLEILQGENAAEWGKRERLETEKLNLERENKKLRTQINDLEERLERKNKQFMAATDSDLKSLQQDIHDKNKELAELKHAHNKLKKVLQDKTTELGHALRRAEQYEAEVKKLRSRVEELKKELATAEDEVDSATNNIRKLQRTNDELQEQVESLTVQVEHLQTRLRNTNHTLISLRGTSGLLQTDNLSEDDNTEY